jgi:hypothetical protein
MKKTRIHTVFSSSFALKLRQGGLLVCKEATELRLPIRFQTLLKKRRANVDNL